MNEESFEKAILVAQSDAHVSIEKKALRNAGFTQVSTFTSGLDLAYHLSEVHSEELERTELVFCQPEFQDMNAIECIKLLRMHPLLAHQAFIGIVSTKEEAKHFLENGFTYVLMRPIDYNAIQKALAYAKAFVKKEELLLKKLLQSADYNYQEQSALFYEKLDALSAQKKSLTEKTNALTALDALNDAMQLIREGQDQKAIPLLAKAGVEEHTAPKVFEVMAGIYAKQKNINQVEKYLKEAIKANAATASYQRMLDLSYRYKQKFPDKLNPLREDFGKFLRGGEAKLKNLCHALQVLDELYPAKMYFKDLFQDAHDLGFKELYAIIRAFVGEDKDLLLSFDAIEKNVKEKEKKSFFNFKKDQKNKELKTEQAKDIKDIALQKSSVNQSENTSLKTSIQEKKWEEIGQISMIDEKASFAYPLDYKEPTSKNMFLNVILGTHQLYKQMNKQEKKKK